MNAFQEPEHISMLRNTLRQFIEKEMPRDKVNQWDKDDYFPREVFDKLCELGVTSLTVPSEYGGSGRDVMATIATIEELCTRSLGIASGYIFCACYAGLNISEVASEEQKQKFLPEVAKGNLLFSYGISEPDVGADVASVKTKAVRDVLTHFSKDIVLNEREFNGNFAEHRNFHLSKCNGDYIFIIDPDEMPTEKLINMIKDGIRDTGSDLIRIPRINIHPGYTEEWLKNYKFSVNEVGWINWPDYICRVFPNNPEIKYGNGLHEVIVGAKTVVNMNPDPSIAIWHIKSIEKQDNRWNLETGDFKSPTGDNLYDTLM